MSAPTINGSSASYVRPATDPGRDWAVDMVDAVLAALRRSAVALCAETDRLPSRVRVAAGDVAVELYWPESEAGAGTGRTDERGAGVPAQRFPTASAPASLGGAPGPAAATAAPPNRDATPAGAGQELTHITSPTVGVFYRAPEPGAKPFVNDGDIVAAGQQVAIIEVMKLMIPVEADQPGRIVEVLHPDATAVEFGERLFSVATADRT